MVKRLLAWSLLLVSCSAYSQTVGSSTFIINDVTVIDATGAPPMPHMTVVVRGQRIAEVRRSRPADVRSRVVIDGNDKYLIPGLSDMHAHVFNQISKRPPNTWYFPLFIANGVTSLREMWTRPTDMPAVRRWRRAFSNGELVSPRIRAVGTILDGPVGASTTNAGMALLGPTVDVVRDRQDAQRQIAAITAAGVDFVKPYSNLSRDAYFAIIDESRKQGLPVAGHVPFLVTAEEASRAGQKSMEHLNQILETCSTDSKVIMAVPGPEWNSEWDQRLVDTYDRSRCQALFSLLAKNRTWQVPTLVRNLEHYFTGDIRSYSEDPRLKYVPESEKKTWSSFISERNSLSISDRQTAGRLWQTYQSVVGDMARAGVPLMTGTDLGVEFIFPGFSVHDELALLVQCGLSPMQALQAATRNPAQYLGIADRTGTVEVGKLADLVLLTADPLIDIRNTQRIDSVIVNGRLFSKTSIQRLLRAAAAFARNN